MARAEEHDDDLVIEHPNRDRASSKSTRVAVVLVLLVSIGLMLVVTLGGWDKLQGSKALLVGYLLVYVLATYLVLRWNRGILPVIAALAIILGIFAAVVGPGVVRPRRRRLRQAGHRRRRARARLHRAGRRPAPAPRRRDDRVPPGVERRGRAPRRRRPAPAAAAAPRVAAPGLAPRSTLCRPPARVAERSDAGLSKSPVREDVRVRIPPRASRSVRVARAGRAPRRAALPAGGATR